MEEYLYYIIILWINTLCDSGLMIFPEYQLGETEIKLDGKTNMDGQLPQEL